MSLSSSLNTDIFKDHALEGWVADKLDSSEGLRFLSRKLERVSGRRVFRPALCLPALLIVVTACSNGASDFNVVIYVVCLE